MRLMGSLGSAGGQESSIDGRSNLESGNASLPDGMPFLVNVPADFAFRRYEYAIPHSVIPEMTFPWDLCVTSGKRAPARRRVNASDLASVRELEFQ